MDFEWVAIALGDVVWIAIAFVMGLLSRSAGLPPLVGFLATGFILNAQGIVSGEMLAKLSDLGITLLLFTVGLKLNIRSLARPQIWAVTSIHTVFVVLVFGVLVYVLAALASALSGELSWQQAFLIAFALSFSSTVFVVKALEEKGEMKSLHGRIAIGILVMQDILAVVFIAASMGKWPSPWALALLSLFALRPLLLILLERVGHDELLVLYGLLLALGGAEAFELVGLKGDLGALVLGAMLANHAKSEELAKTMLAFKDLFLLGFFLSIGLSGELSWGVFALGLILVPLVFIKTATLFWLFTRFRLRARTALLSSVDLSNYSEFGLIVIAIGVSTGMVPAHWLIVLAVAVSLSFVLSALMNKQVIDIYMRNRERLMAFQKERRLAYDRMIDIGGARIAVIGMGAVGTGAYNSLHERFGDSIVGIDIDPLVAVTHRDLGRNVLVGDAGEADFWDRVHAQHTLEQVFLALPRCSSTLAVLKQLRLAGFDGHVAAIARYEDEVERLDKAGVDTAFNIYSEAGAGFVSHVVGQ